MSSIDADYDQMIECPKCGASYRAFYKIVLTPAHGVFHCQQCQAEVHRWHGVRDYDCCAWVRITGAGGTDARPAYSVSLALG